MASASIKGAWVAGTALGVFAAEALGLRLARLGGSRSNVGRSAKKAKPSWGLKAWVTVRLRKTGIPLPGEADIIAPIIPRTLLKTL